MTITLLLTCMFFMHIVDDYYLQGILAKMKQKSWWEENAPNPLYKNDYKIALIEHAFSWSFCIHLPLITYSILTDHPIPVGLCILSMVINTAVHAYVDNTKANKHTINLVIDQICHFIQITATWCAFLYFLI